MHYIENHFTSSGRLFFAFFMKKNELHADLLSQALSNRIGVQSVKLVWKHHIIMYTFKYMLLSSSMQTYFLECRHWS